MLCYVDLSQLKFIGLWLFALSASCTIKKNKIYQVLGEKLNNWTVRLIFKMEVILKISQKGKIDVKTKKFKAWIYLFCKITQRQ